MVGRRQLVGIGMLVLSGIVLWPLADALIIGVVTAYGLRFLIERMETFVGRRPAEVVIMSAFFILVSGAVYLLISNAGTVALELLRLSQSLSEGVKTVLAPYDLPYLSEFVLGGISSLSGYLRTAIFVIVGEIPWVLLELLTYFFVVFYFYRDGDRVSAALEEFIDGLPAESAAVARDVRDSISKVLRDVFVVYGTYGLIIGTLGAVGFYVIGVVVRGEPVPFFWAWGILIGLSAFIEGLASIVFTGPLIGFYVVNGEVVLGMTLLVFQMLFLGILPETFLLPYLGTRRLNESYLTIILGFLSGPLVFGLKGVILGPVFVITLKNLLVSRFLEPT